MESNGPDGKLVYKRTVSGIGADVNDSMIVLDSVRGEYYSLNPVGRHLWLNLEQGATLDQLVMSVRDEFEVESDICRDSVVAFLKDMVELGLVSRR